MSYGWKIIIISMTTKTAEEMSGIRNSGAKEFRVCNPFQFLQEFCNVDKPFRYKFSHVSKVRELNSVSKHRETKRQTVFPDLILEPHTSRCVIREFNHLSSPLIN